MATAKEADNKILDSCANVSIVSILSRLDSNTFPTILRVDDPSAVETVNNSTMAIQGQGKLEGIDSV